MAPPRERLDLALVRRGLAVSRHRAQQMIEAGVVSVSGKTVRKPSAMVAPGQPIIVTDAIPYVSRGGLKLEAALDSFGVRVCGRVALDVGASTGGFTDCLLRHGAVRIYAVDVGHGQLAESLRGDPRVVVMEDCDIRQVESLPEQVDLAVVDVSFISLRLVLPSVARLVGQGGEVIALIKPQFEAGPGAVDRRGVLRDKRVREEVVAAVVVWLREQGWKVLALIPSPVEGGDGNIEYLAHALSPAFRKGPEDRA